MIVGAMVMMVAVMVIMVRVMVMMVRDHQYCHMTLSVRGTVTVIMMVGCVLAHTQRLLLRVAKQGTGA